MCRITGFWDFNYKGDYDLKRTTIAMRDTLTHGGPDDAGIYIEPQTGIALAHRRLSILDLSHSGHQPMEFKNLVITYNGEIYNFREIREELEKKGYKFTSNTDTEVVLKAFHKWGIKAVHKFRGMFAFAIWDKKKKKLYLFRDRIGVKPLYWYFKDGLFMFSSELKAFHKHPKFRKELNKEALALYLQYGYISGDYSIFQNTYKLLPGHFLVINSRGKIKLSPYWSIEEFFLRGEKEKENWLKRSEEELIEELENLLTESFKLRLIADVPVGIFLSGGIDSTAVTTLLTKKVGVKLKTFTIGFYEKGYNEAPFAKKIAEFLGTEHTEFYCTPKDTLEIIPKLPEIYDEPFGDSSAIPTYLVSKLAKQKVKVALSADGGDEQFCGYTRYWIMNNRINKFSKLPFSNFIGKTLKLINPEIALKIYNTFKFILPQWTNFRDKYIKLINVLENAGNFKAQYDISNKIFLPKDLTLLGLELKRFLTNLRFIPNISLEPLKFMMLYDLKTYLPDDILVKVDRATMAVSLEGREPFLDHKLVEWTSQLPVEFKYRKGISKYLLRKVLYKYIPKHLVDRPKQGFGVPIYEWFKDNLKNLYKEYLNYNRIKQGGILNPEEVNKLLKAYFENKGVNHNKLWLLFIFELWREKWM